MSQQSPRVPFNQEHVLKSKDFQASAPARKYFHVMVEDAFKNISDYMRSWATVQQLHLRRNQCSKDTTVDPIVAAPLSPGLLYLAFQVKRN